MAVLARDQVTLADLTDGVSVILEKYAHIFNGTTGAAVAGSTTCTVTALVGADRVACTVTQANIESPVGVSVTVGAFNSATMQLPLTITCTTSFVTPGFIKVPVDVNGLVIIQTIAVSFAKTGATGTSATLVGLKNEAQMIPCDATGKVLADTIVSVDFYGYVGSTRTAVTATVDAAALTATGSSAADRVSIVTNTAGTGATDGVLSLKFPKDSQLGAVEAGSLPVSLVCNGLTRIAPFSWSKARRGADGIDSYALDVTSSAGNIFKNTAVTTTLTANVYKGGTPLTGAALTAAGVIKWYKDGVYLTGKDGATLAVGAGDVTDSATYVAQLEG